MTVGESTEMIRAIGELFIGIGAIGAFVMGIKNHVSLVDVKHQTDGLVAQGRADSKAEGKQEQKDERAASDEADRINGR
jgi:hypothetical protein